MKCKWFEAIEFVFKISCFLVVFIMFGLWIKKYIDDEDVCLVDYQPFTEVPDQLVPELSICFRHPFLQEKFKGLEFDVNASTYLEHLTGKVFQQPYNQIDYNNITLNLEDYFLSKRVVWRNGSISSNTNVELRSTFSGFIHYFFVKCFTTDTKTLNIPAVRLIRYDFKNEVLMDYRKASDHSWGLSVHGPNQFLLQQQNFRSFSRNNNKSNGLSVDVRISKIEVLKRRNKRKEPCVTEWNRWDDLIVLKPIEKIGCSAPYHRSFNEFSVCSRKEDMRALYNEWFKVKNKFEHPPCLGTPRIDARFLFNHIKEINELTKNTNIFRVFVRYPEQVMLITQTQSINGQAVIGNIGGYIGLFLGIYY